MVQSLTRRTLASRSTRVIPAYIEPTLRIFNRRDGCRGVVRWVVVEIGDGFTFPDLPPRSWWGHQRRECESYPDTAQAIDWLHGWHAQGRLRIRRHNAPVNDY